MSYIDIPTLEKWKNDTSVLRNTARGSVLDKIDADIKNYHEAFSEMTKRNLLNDIGRNIVAWEKIHLTKVSKDTAVLSLKEVTGRKLKEFSPSTFKYKKVLCLAFNVGCNTITDDYFRFSNNDKADMHGKCNEMMGAIREAQKRVKDSGVDNDETLKIFMAPEFYFRGINGAYSYDLVSQIISTMNGLGTNGPEFQHWLFVYGTAIAASQDEVTYCNTCGNNPNTVEFNRDPKSRVDAHTGLNKKTIGVCKNDPAHPLITGVYGADIQNVALIQKANDIHMVIKEYISGIDYKNNLVNVTQGTKKNQKFIPLNAIEPAGGNTRTWGRIPSKFQDERMGGGIFTIDGITIGMEICLDHTFSTGPAGRLSNHAGSIQILLIPSYGMDITHHSCINNGIIFNVDGQIDGSSKVVIKGWLGPPLVSRKTAANHVRGEIERWGPFDIPRRL